MLGSGCADAENAGRLVVDGALPAAAPPDADVCAGSDPTACPGAAGALLMPAGLQPKASKPNNPAIGAQTKATVVAGVNDSARIPAAIAQSRPRLHVSPAVRSQRRYFGQPAALGPVPRGLASALATGPRQSELRCTAARCVHALVRGAGRPRLLPSPSGRGPEPSGAESFAPGYRVRRPDTGEGVPRPACPAEEGAAPTRQPCTGFGSPAPRPPAADPDRVDCPTWGLRGSPVAL